MADETNNLVPITETRVQEMIDNATINLRNSTELFKTHTTIPAHTPKNIYEQIWPYVNGTDKRLYWYDLENNTWRYGVEFDIDAHDTADSRFLYKVGAVNVTDPSTATDVFSKSIPADLLSTNGLIRIKMYVSDWSVAGTSTKTTFYWNFGGGQDTIVDELTNLASTARSGIITADLVANGATNSQVLYTRFNIQEPDGYTIAFGSQFVTTTTSNFTVDTTSAQTLKFQVLMTTASGNNKFNITDALIYGLQSG